MANYWDGSAWKPLTLAEEAGKKRDISIGRSISHPFDPMAGYSNVFMFKGPSAAVTLGQNPRFCFPTSAGNINTKVEYFIGVLRVKKNDREIEKFIRDSRTGGGNLMFPQDKTLTTDVKRLSDRFVEVTPKRPLSEGQYVIGTNAMLMFDFGVR